MKTKSTLLWFALIFSLPAFAQQNININNINGRFMPDGMIGFNGTDAGIEAPAGSGIKSIFGGSLWIGAKDAADNLHVAALRYQQTGTDFWAGPIGTTYDAAYDLKYNRVWKVDKATILQHIADHNNVGYVVPASIADWPGNGNIANGEAPQLAPFVDVNTNGVYEPAIGDYPDIKGDEALFVIYNDDRDVHGESGGAKLGVEVHLMVYAYANSGTTASNSVFMHFTIVNRSNTEYHDMVLGLWHDFDLGNYANDRVGCDSVNNCYFAYNGTTPDVNTGGVIGYGTVRPFMGVAFLNRQMEVFNYQVNGAAPAHADAVTAQEYYNQMNGLWNDNTPFTYGGAGYGGSTPTKYIFMGNPCDNLSWSDNTSGLAPNDRRAMGATGKQTLAAGDFTCLDAAYVYYESPTGVGCNTGHYDGFIQTINSAKTFYNNTAQTDCLAAAAFPSGVNDIVNSVSINVFPVPASSVLNVTTNTVSKQATLRLLDITGKEMLSRQLNGAGQLTTQVDVSKLSAGIYILNVQAEGVSKSVKVTVQH